MIDYLPEIDADFRVFYHYPKEPDGPGIAEEHFGAFSGLRFLRLAWRLPSYQGAVAAKVLHEKEKAEKDKAPRTPMINGRDYEEASLERTIQSDADLIEYETV